MRTYADKHKADSVSARNTLKTRMAPRFAGFCILLADVSMVPGVA